MANVPLMISREMREKMSEIGKLERSGARIQSETRLKEIRAQSPQERSLDRLRYLHLTAQTEKIIRGTEGDMATAKPFPCN